MFRIELEDAISVIKENCKEIDGYEVINLLEANGRVLGEDIYAPINNPPFNRSPLDGYALISDDTIGASKDNPVKLKVVDEVFAGSYSNMTLQKGEAIRIMTGAKLPEGADCVIRQEQTNESMEVVEIYEELKKYDNFCFKGEDIVKDDLLMKKGEVLTYVHLGILASMGFNEVKVKRKLKIALLTTGDEVCEPGKELKEGKIFDSNMHLINLRMRDFGIIPTYSEILGDDYKKIGERILEIIDDVDAIITTGGVSVGKKDIFHEVLPFIQAKRLFWKVNLKPGTPAMFSILNNKPILSLSGNPFAALSTFELLGRPLLSQLESNKNIDIKVVPAILDGEFLKSSKVRRFVRATYENGVAKVNSNKHSSGMLFSMIGCNALIDIKGGSPSLSKGDKVSVILL